jgi:hypothetical protein
VPCVEPRRVNREFPLREFSEFPNLFHVCSARASVGQFLHGFLGLCAMCMFALHPREALFADDARQHRSKASRREKTECASEYRLLFSGRPGGGMAQLDVRACVLEEWFRLPESRRRHATDAVAFAFRLLRERPELVSVARDLSHESIVKWLLPHIHATGTQ